MYSRMPRQPCPFHPARRIAVTLAALSVTMFIPTARAADKPTQSRSGADATEQPAYRKTIEDGLAEYDARHFEEARSLFRRAHEISPNARTFRGIGMTSFELRDYVSAVRNLSAALQDKRKPLSPEQRKHTQDLLDRSRMFVDVYTLKVSPPNSRVIIDGHAPEFEPDGTLVFGFGTHTVEASAHGMAVRSIPITVRGGERKELAVTLERASSAGAAGRGQGSPGPDCHQAIARSAVEWGCGRMAVGQRRYGGAGDRFRHLLDQPEFRLSSCRNPAAGLRCTNESSVKTQRNIAIGATLGTGAAALTMALIGILSWHSAPPAAHEHSALDCSVGPFGINCAGSLIGLQDLTGVAPDQVFSASRAKSDRARRASSQGSSKSGTTSMIALRPNIAGAGIRSARRPPNFCAHASLMLSSAM